MTVYGNISPLQFGSVSMVTATLGANDPEIGTTRREGDEDYVFVFNSGGSTIGVGYGAIVTATSNYSVTVSSITHTDYPIGVCKHTAIPTVNYGWLMTRGFGTAYALSALVAGDLVCLGTDGKWVPRLVTTAYSQVVAPAVFGKCMVSAAAAASAEVYFHIR